MDIRIKYCSAWGYENRAARLAADIKDRLGLEVIIEPGASRQFDVLVDDKVIATRNKGWLKRMFGGGWPDVDEVAAKLGTN